MGCDLLTVVNHHITLISTHTSRVGCDAKCRLIGLDSYNISTHTSRVGCDKKLLKKKKQKRISTHTSRVGCDRITEEYYDERYISTHTSRVGCDRYKKRCPPPIITFLLTHPVWDVTWWGQFLRELPNFYSHIPCGMWRRGLKRSNLLDISTHTSRVGCDRKKDTAVHSRYYFYSHIPCGMWRIVITVYLRTIDISTHTSRVGCD